MKILCARVPTLFSVGFTFISFARYIVFLLPLFWGANTFASNQDTLPTHQWLNVDESLVSQNGAYELLMQADGNLVIYRTADGVPTWATTTAGNPGTRAVMQGHGNLVLYSTSGEALWGSPGVWVENSRLKLQNNGDLVILTPNNSVQWNSGANQDSLLPHEWMNVHKTLFSENGAYKLVMQGDGNLVLYRVSDNVPTWATNTHGNPGTRAVMQGHGNLVLYGTDGHAKWGSPGPWIEHSTLKVRNDGKIVILDPNNNVQWSAGSSCTTVSLPVYGGYWSFGTGWGSHCSGLVYIPERTYFYIYDYWDFGQWCSIPAEFNGYRDQQVCD